MSSGGLTEEQRKRIEENRRKALEKRAALLSQRQPKDAPPTRAAKTSSATVKCNAGKFASNCVLKTTGEECGLFTSGRNKTSVPQRQPSVQSVGERPSTSSNDLQASNSYMYTNGHPAVNSQNTSVGSTTSTCKTSNEPTSLNSFQNKISKFYRPQNVFSSSCSPVREFQTKLNSNSSVTSSSVSVSASNRTVPSKVSAAHTLNVKGKSGKTVKGNCVLISRQRFTVVVPYQAQLIGIFKTIPSRSYGKLYPILWTQRDFTCCFMLPEHIWYILYFWWCGESGGCMCICFHLQLDSNPF